MAILTAQTLLMLVAAYVLGAGLALALRRSLQRARRKTGRVRRRSPGQRSGEWFGRRENRQLAAVLVEGFLARLGFSVITFALPLYALSVGMNLTEIGLLAAVRPAMALLAKPLVGRLADRYGVKTVYAISIALRGIVGLLFVTATSPAMLFSIRALHGISSAARDPTSALLIAEGADGASLARAFSWYATAKILGASLGFPLAGLVLSVAGEQYGLVFAGASVASFIALAMVLWLVPAQHGAATESHGEGDAAPPTEQAEAPGVQWLGLAGLALVVSLPASMINGLLPVIATEWSGLSKAELAIVLTASQVVTVFAGPLLGWAADRVSRGLVLSIRSASNILSSLGYLVFPGFIGFGCARLADDIGKAGFRPAWGAMMADQARTAKARDRGRVIANLDTASSLGEAAGPVLAGLLWQHGGITWMLGVRVALSVIAEIYAVSLARGRARRAVAVRVDA